MGTFTFTFSAIFTKGKKTLVTSCLLSKTMKPFQNGSTLKEKNLLLASGRFALKLKAKMKIKELLPLKVYPLTFR